MKLFQRRGLERALREGPATPDESMPSEIFSVDRLEHFAEQLARAQEIVTSRSAGISLRSRLRTNAAGLGAAYDSLTAGLRGGQAVTPAAEWLLDNYYIVDEHIQAVRRDLPAGFYRELPKLSNGPLRGYPRVYGLALGLISHTDNRIELDTLERFCRAYQRVQPLTIGELWAIAITLRIVLIDNLSSLAAGITSRMAQRAEANALADKVMPHDADAPAQKTLLRAVGVDRLRNAFAAQLFQRLRDQDADDTPTLAWLHRSLAAHGTTADEIVHSEHQRQGAVNLSVRNVITSLRLISAVDWAEFFESVSLVDDLLRTQSTYDSFDFATHDLYRHAIEDLSRHSKHTEIEVAQHALDAAGRGASQPADGHRRAPAAHASEPGCYLIGAGRAAFEKELGYRVPWQQRITRLTRAVGVTGYVTSIAALSTLMGAGFGMGMHTAPLGTAITVTIVALAILAASDVAITLVNLWVNHYCAAQVLPGLELRDGVPREFRTVVAIPILLTTVADIEDYIRALEVHFLATQDGDLRFALLSDWTDSSTETAPQDDVLLAAAVRGIELLNRAHGSIEGDDRFLLLHRHRSWNRAQGKWMGWERKRGKLHELNRLLRGARDTHFIAAGGLPIRVPEAVRYVITLDADTRLPRGAALALIRKMAHPLNQPFFDEAMRRVTAGYGILQPRVTPTLPVAHEATFFQSIFSGPSGMDPYAFAVSDVYQDLFGEGSYSGKGIYDVTAFEAALAGRLSDNRLLSHDLFEGIFARAGLASDVEVIEEYPAQYTVASARSHRWTRGDWQLLPWVLGLSVAPPLLGRWKMFDNLRRSLVPPAILSGLASTWIMASGAWTGFFAAALSLPVVLPFLFNLRPQLADLRRAGYYRATGREAAQVLAMVALRVGFLADQTWVMLHAIVQTLYRLAISRRNLLQWTTFAQSTVGASSSPVVYYRSMAASVGIALGVGLSVLIVRHAMPWAAIPFLITWLVAPVIARAVSVPSNVKNQQPLRIGDAQRLRLMARQTWSFFDTFVTATENHLPPDNFQEIPNAVIAHRTSPTNIGLYLLSIAAAREFGWIGTFDAMQRLEATLASLAKLETYRGHLYNWYDTHDLRPLDPKYISTVDSGNLAGHLLTLEGFLLRWLTDEIQCTQYKDGMLDTLEGLRHAASMLDDGRRNYGVTPRQLEGALNALRTQLAAPGISAAADMDSILAHVNGIHDIAQALDDERAAGNSAPLLAWSTMLSQNALSHRRDLECPAAAADDLKMRMSSLARRANTFALSMEFGFLIEPDRQLLAIGYRVMERELDPSCYDLLASEARLASFVAIAKGDVPVRHWFRLGRLLTPVHRGSALVSWSGSMFEYLMPVLVMREPAGSVLGETARLTVKRQIEFGDARKLPWGVSESAFNARDREFTYQYSSFGIPGLGLKRGLGEEAVVAPYATALAAMLRPEAALANFERLEKLGARGDYGWYDALDFTPARLPEGAQVAAVQAYMAHHQGMILVAITNVLRDGMVRACFHSNPIIQATELLLQEKTPRDSELSSPRLHESQSAPEQRELPPALPRRFDSPHHVAPRTHLLSNGNYSVMVTAAGSGYSRWRDIAVTRWREDPTLDPWGYYVFMRDVTNGQVWSAGYQPIGKEPDRYEVSFYEDRAEIVRRDGPIVTATEILVSSEYDAEVRRISVTNEGRGVREIELTTYAEVVLSTPAADSAHPAFSKMFVQTEYVADSNALLATRRPREPGEQQLWAVHFSSLEGEAIGGLQFETDRARFLGRGQDLRSAVSIVDARPLSNTAGTVLDPVFSLRRRVRIPPGETVRVAFWTGISSDRGHALALVDTHRDMTAFDRAKTLAWTQAQVQLRYLGVDFDEAQEFQRIANRILYADSALRAAKEILEKNRLGPAALWPHGISGDLPIVLLRIDDDADLGIVKQLLRAHEYWQLKRLAVDLVILNDRPPSYASELQQTLEAIIRAANTGGREGDSGSRGSVVLLRSDLIPGASRDLLQTAARAVFVARRGRLSDQLARLREAPPVPRRRRQNPAVATRADASRSVPASEFFNGLGGFAENGREYRVVLNEGQWTPAPWINVIANPQFGFQVSADGAGSTWSQNAQQNQITPWSNDPVSDGPSEAIYLRDEANGELWSATSLPIRDPGHTYVAWHGFGYTRYEHSSRGIALELLQYVPLADSIKISRLKITNRGKEPRQLSVTHYVDLVLGNQRSRSAPFIVTEIDAATGAMLARNPWSIDFAPRVAFVDMRGRQHSCTADRAEFIGRHGSLSEPAALLVGTPLSNHVGGGLDPCAALQTRFTLGPGDSTEVVFLLGEEGTAETAVALLERYRRIDLDAVLKAVRDFWDQTLCAVQVKTPDRSLDIVANGWLLYQALSCRIWGRTGFYQSSGAYGFRDQLQDVMALCVSAPTIAREHILRAAARQFEEGDVQHWWLPTTGQGVKTRVADDRIWISFVVEHYLEVTGDHGILDVPVTYLQGGPLTPAQHETFGAPASANPMPLYDHCVRGLNSSLAIGSHGLPLFGTGDWNDGMNRVGAGGLGESVWMGWFLYASLMRFAPIAERRGDTQNSTQWVKHAFALQQAIEREAWDGDWYRRGYFDDGTPLGSVSSDECRIDAIAQSWAVISGAADPERAVRAMSAVNTQLVSRSDGLVQLFTPPFDHTRHDPGYIKAYPPGLRENGGQYTHAAMWTTLAFAAMGDGDRAGELFSLLNPINHASTRAGIHRYKVEPYVVCADVYSAAPHVGRGGWTWYTGSAAWMYRTAVEGILGFKLHGDRLIVDPCIPRAWSGFEFTYKHGTSRYRVTVENPNGVSRGVVFASLDGQELSRSVGEFVLVDDGRYHFGQITLG